MRAVLTQRSSSTHQFRSNTHVEPYRDYCGHCPALYTPVIEKYGFVVDYYLINPAKGECRLHVRKPDARARPGR